MDKAIVDVVSMVTILHDRKIGAHDGEFSDHLFIYLFVAYIKTIRIDIETFSMNPGNGKMTSCIQVKLHPYY